MSEYSTPTGEVGSTRRTIIPLRSRRRRVRTKHLLTALRDDDSVRVIVFDSTNPEFFIPHVDVALADMPDAFDKFEQDLPDGVNAFQALGELLRHQPPATIKLAGMARGGAYLVSRIASADLAAGRVATSSALSWTWSSSAHRLTSPIASACSPVTGSHSNR
ncbi:hypothetical protein ABZ860_36225 [Microbispora sp. NPDC046973]|uniref:hypothetical protein n=1 Tax=Microbispora sp. NPDC046973 TaxID=3155022 RepID=UPI0034110318